jgi:hypothetical protein
MSYYQDARRRAQRRRSPWNLLLIPAVLLPAAGLWCGIVEALQAFHRVFYPGETLGTASHSIGPILTAVSPMFAVLPIAMLIGNGLVWLVPPMRRVLDAEAAPHPGTGFWDAQRQLLRGAKYLVPIGLGAGALGAFLTWG